MLKVGSWGGRGNKTIILLPYQDVVGAISKPKKIISLSASTTLVMSPALTSLRSLTPMQVERLRKSEIYVNLLLITQFPTEMFNRMSSYGSATSPTQMTDIIAASSGNCDLHSLITVFYRKVKTLREKFVSCLWVRVFFLAQSDEGNASLSLPDVISSNRSSIRKNSLLALTSPEVSSSHNDITWTRP